MAVKKTNKAEAQSSSAPRYALAELKAHAKELFEVRTEVLAGAMYGIDGALFTVAEVKEKIQQFMKAKVV
ncbi:hypothetical protein PVOR_29174 [Paenibacillus vortex V453]|jgi:hypothetical protein|uniref:YqzN/YkzM domain-containing protein n=2 Tax=Paenibacillus TaxID=44249 RepID=A0A163H1S0_9BACL|nr:MULTISPECIES: hypothetical protein [Paenibacillus]ANA79328.1 hypothetical protein A3958_04655 [Paenibacillus glucanolyticus]AVV56729.1 hypothetical protein C7121_11670 [Paenibacillus glucanolyticus]AWP25895.1 hypothetical protein B9D94_04340 [Paenibacillus sp. Cedars]EFU38683.1 hypothetical protein PVOR_29174 [Paenibacillus vortex V453]ETT29727.1 hypothetical protein C169_28857 [Paenibacillus sp. FSL R5-808]